MLELTPSQYGFYFGIISVGYMLGNFLSGRFAKVFGLNRMMLSGNVVAVSGMVLAIVLFAAGFYHPLSLFGPVFFTGVGNGMTLPSANAGIVSVKPHLAGSASGLGGALQIGGGAALSMLAGALMTPQSGPFPLLWVMLLSSAAAARRDALRHPCRATRGTSVMSATGNRRLVLAGGRATRLGGGDKPLRPLGGRPMLARILERLRPQVGPVAISANGDPARFAEYGLPVLADDGEQAGPLSGISSGMAWAKRPAVARMSDGRRRHAVLSARSGGAAERSDRRKPRRHRRRGIRRPAASGLRAVAGLAGGRPQRFPGERRDFQRRGLHGPA